MEYNIIVKYLTNNLILKYGMKNAGETLTGRRRSKRVYGLYTRETLRQKDRIRTISRKASKEAPKEQFFYKEESLR